MEMKTGRNPMYQIIYFKATLFWQIQDGAKSLQVLQGENVNSTQNHTFKIEIQFFFNLSSMASTLYIDICCTITLVDVLNYPFAQQTFGSPYVKVSKNSQLVPEQLSFVVIYISEGPINGIKHQAPVYPLPFSDRNIKESTHSVFVVLQQRVLDVWKNIEIYTRY